MENVREFIDPAHEWHKENKDGRAIIIIAIEGKPTDSTIVTDVEISTTVIGRRDLLNLGVKGVMNDNVGNLADFIGNAARELTYEKIMGL